MNGFSQEVIYNTGNYQKHKTKNVLKRMLVDRFNKRIIDILTHEFMPYKIGSGSIRILDAGCGEGFITCLLAEKINGAEVVGVDGAAEAISTARLMHPKLCFEEGNLYALNFEDRAFDVVLCSEVLEHLQNPSKALRELSRVSRYGMVLTVPNEPFFCLGNIVSFHNIMRLGNPIDHIQHWTYWGFRHFICSALPSYSYNARFYSSFPWSIACVPTIAPYCNEAH